MGDPERTPTTPGTEAGTVWRPGASGRLRAGGDARALAIEEITDAVRRLTVESQRLGHSFADRNGLHPTDFEALVHVMDAEGRGSPLTPGDLSTELGLTSGATTGVIDRLERQGHVRRDRDDADRRRLHIRYADRGAGLAMEFFGGLRGPRDALMAGFSDDDLAVVRRFLIGMTDLLANHRTSTAPTADAGDAGHAGIG